MRTIRFLVLAVASFFLFSCDNITEEIHLNEDGSGEYRIYSDVIPGMVKMATEITSMTAKMDSTGDTSEEAIRKKAIEKVWEDFPDEIDSTYNLAEGAPDSLVNYGNNRKYMENMTGFMRGGKSKGYVHQGMEYTFSDMENLNGFLSFANEAMNEKSAERTGKLMGGMNTQTNTTYTWRNRTFSRSVEVISPQDLEDPSMKFLMTLMGDAEYTTIVHTPRKVKLVNEGGRITAEKEVTFTYKLMDMLSGKVEGDFEIVMEE